VALFVLLLAGVEGRSALRFDGRLLPAALFGVIGIGWLVVVPMYKGWTPLNRRMSQRIRKSIRAMAKETRPGAC